MLDIRTSCLLKIINEKCAEGSYKVISLNDLINDFPLRYVADADLIRQMMGALSSGGYISLKFDRNDEFCLCPTPKGREYFELEKSTSSINKSRFSRFLPYLYNTVSIAVGVFIAVLLLRLLRVIC